MNQDQEEKQGADVPPSYSYSQQYNPQPQVIVQQPEPQSSRYGYCKGRRDNYPSTAGIVLGSLLIVCGIICIVLGIVAIIVKAATTIAGHGIWTGVVFVITGSITVAAGKSKLAGFIVASMVMAIVSSSSMISNLVSGSITGLVKNLNECSQGYLKDYGKVDCDAGVGINAAQLAMALIILPLTIGVAILACVATRCKCKGNQCHVNQHQPIQTTVTSSQYTGNSVGQPMQGYGAPTDGYEKGQNPPPYSST